MEAAVVGVLDQVFGEQVKAFIVLKDGQETTAESIRKFCEENLADYKVPKYIQFIDEPLPRNPGGKVRKEVLRTMDG